jgi:primosomal protein N' (replication factor Y)
MQYAQVVVNTPVVIRKPLEEENQPNESLRERAFTYSIPAHLADKIALGQLVWVPFGSRRLQGIIIAFSETSPVEQTKDIDEIADARPLLSITQLELARWMARTYLCSLYDALSLMLPPGIEQPTEILLSLAPEFSRDNLTPKQLALVDVLARDGSAKLSQLPRDLRAAVDPLAQRGIVIKKTVVAPVRAKPKRVNMVRLLSEEKVATLTPRLQEKARQIVEFLKSENKPVWVSAIYAALEISSLQDLRKLEAAGIVALEEKEIWRDSLAGRVFDVVEPPKLTSEQEVAWQEISSKFKVKSSSERPEIFNLEPVSLNMKPETFLLHGVTGSGKTEIYMRALAEIIAQGKQGIVLVPEISLTPQTLRRFGARFKRMVVIHSRLSIGERYDTWRRCRAGLIDVVIGARSALFAPVPHLGLIVIDEEHDASYKQAETPHYHTRAVALELARRVGATVILGSATPALETYYRAARGEFTLLELPKRVMGHAQIIQKSKIQIPNSKLVVRELGADYPDARYLDLPPVEIVDLRAELKAGNRSMFSRALQREMARVLAAREQVILFLNRRGTATFILCRDCGYVFKCRRCDNPMTFHGTGDQLVCHHCNRRDRVPTKCPQCGGARIRFFGVGTEKVEAEIQTLFPQARTLRWDWDVTQGKRGSAHEAILEKFVQRQADILIGTQMIAKGLDLPFVTLVGVVSADTSLNLPDFRAGERTFQLLTQVAGRAGRSILGGKVIVQTYNPDHYAIVAAAQHDYRAFYDREIAFRREQNYPPFSRLIRLLYSHANEKQAQNEAIKMQRALATRIAQRGLPAIDLIGPAPAFFHRVRGEYRYQIIVRGENPNALVQDIALPLGWRVDVDPESVL